jgi:drug/metabolite transporter (DMT)-like permease
VNGGVPPRALALLLVLTLVWGTNWPLFPLATREVSVWTFRAVALLIAGPTLLAVARWKGYNLAVERRHWGTLATATAFYLLLWNVASTYAAILIPSGQAAILGFTMPLWLALVSWAVLGHTLAPRTLLAIALGGAAVGLLMWDGLDVYARAPMGFFLGLLAGFGWACGTLIIKQRPINSPALVTTGWQLIGAAVPTGLVALAIGEGPWFWPSWTSIIVIGYIALVPMSIGNAAWFAIVGLLPAQVAGLSSIAVPVVAMVSGAIVHGEPLGALQWAAMVCCVGGLWLALAKPSKPPGTPGPPEPSEPSEPPRPPANPERS